MALRLHRRRQDRKTPAFDRVAREGVLFPYAYTAAPTCTASRGSILTGQWFARLEQGGDLWSTLPAKFDVYPDLLERQRLPGRLHRQGMGSGRFQPGGRTRNPAGPEYNQRTSLLRPPGSTISITRATSPIFSRGARPASPSASGMAGTSRIVLMKPGQD